VSRPVLYVLAGVNGAGKSSVLKLISLLERPTRGTVTVNGQSTGALPDRKIPAFRRGVETFRRHFHAFALGATSYGRPSNEAQVILDELPRMQVDDPEAVHGNR
jgi:ABC-type polar amino acid transport system ATPase subunit